MANPKASVTVTFSSSTTDTGDEDQYVLQAEVKAEDNNGLTQFPFGGTAPIYRIYRSENIVNVEQFTTDGSVQVVSGGSSTESVTENVTFSNSRTVSVSYPIIEGTLSAVRLGNTNLGALSVSNPAEIQCSKESTGPLDPIIGTYRITYSTRYRRYRLTGVERPSGFGTGDFTSYPVHVHLVGVVE